ncbi:MAG TPA: outer membrane lipoprotein-sorting protein [Myxococcota bacterium]|nr:outer membrane lipoprotein-sorting protein [Myxococcota bacterium]
MRGWIRGCAGVCVGAVLALCASASEDVLPLAADVVKDRWHARLGGKHFSARVKLSMDMGGIHEERELLVWRTDEAVGAERVMVRFTQPESVRNVGVLFLEQQGRPNDYFLYQPELRRVRRLPEAVANEDVYGIDLEFLGFGVAQSEPTEVDGMKRETLDGRAAYRLTERALRDNPRFDERVTWVDAQTYIPMRTEQYRLGRKRLVARTVETRAVNGIETPMRMEFENQAEDRRVLLRVAEVDYEVAIPEEYFSTLALVRTSLAAGAAAEAAKPSAAK